MPTLRHRLAALVGAMTLMSTAFLFGGVAQAQSYPPGTSVPACTVGDANAGTVAVGQSIKFILCGNFAAGATITLTVNGTAVTGITKTPANGAVTVDIKVDSTTLIEIDDPVQVAITCGTTNTVTASGPTAGGGTAVSHGTFAVLCAATTATTTAGGLAFTGGNVVAALAVAVVLIVLGALMVIFQRRRRQTV